MEVQLPLVLFTLLAGAGGGTMVFLCIADMLGFDAKVGRTACSVTAGLLVVGGLCSVLHLAQKMHVMAAVMNIGSFSGISMELIGLTVCFVLVALYWLLCRKGQSAKARRAVAVLCCLAGLAFCYIQGSSYVIAARPYWDTLLLPLGYWASGLAAGGVIFLSILVALGRPQEFVKRIATFALGALALQLVLYAAFAISVGEAALVDNGAIVWGLEFIVGTLIPFALVVAVRQGKDPRLVYVAVACVLIGGAAFRCMMWILGVGQMPSLFDLARDYRGLINW